MSDITDALVGLKTILADLDPSPQDNLAAVYVWPDDYDSMDYASGPFAVVAQIVNEPFGWQPVSQGDGLHRWDAEILIMIEEGPIKTLERLKTVEAKQVDYLLAVAKIIFDDRSLNGTVFATGGAESLLLYQIGHVEFDGNVFWGIRFRLPVAQIHSLPVGGL